MALTVILFSFFFFFSSRRRHTRCSRDWSSDVCSSDLMSSARTKHRPVAWTIPPRHDGGGAHPFPGPPRKSYEFRSSRGSWAPPRPGIRAKGATTSSATLRREACSRHFESGRGEAQGLSCSRTVFHPLHDRGQGPSTPQGERAPPPHDVSSIFPRGPSRRLRSPPARGCGW